MKAEDAAEFYKHIRFIHFLLVATVIAFVIAVQGNIDNPLTKAYHQLFTVQAFYDAVKDNPEFYEKEIAEEIQRAISRNTPAYKNFVYPKSDFESFLAGQKQFTVWQTERFQSLNEAIDDELNPVEDFFRNRRRCAFAIDDIGYPFQGMLDAEQFNDNPFSLIETKREINKIYECSQVTYAKLQINKPYNAYIYSISDYSLDRRTAEFIIADRDDRDSQFQRENFPTKAAIKFEDEESFDFYNAYLVASLVELKDFVVQQQQYEYGFDPERSERALSAIYNDYDRFRGDEDALVIYKSYQFDDPKFFIVILEENAVKDARINLLEYWFKRVKLHPLSPPIPRSQLRSFEVMFPELNEFSDLVNIEDGSKVFDEFKKLANMSGGSIEAFGFNISDGPVLRIWSFVIIFMLVAYLFLHISRLYHHQCRKPFSITYPWFGFYNDLFSRLSFIVTVVFIPTVAGLYMSYLLYFEYYFMHAYFGCITSGAIFIMGIKTVYKSRKICILSAQNESKQ